MKSRTSWFGAYLDDIIENFSSALRRGITRLAFATSLCGSGSTHSTQRSSGEKDSTYNLFQKIKRFLPSPTWTPLTNYYLFNEQCPMLMTLKQVQTVVDWLTVLLKLKCKIYVYYSKLLLLLTGDIKTLGRIKPNHNKTHSSPYTPYMAKPLSRWKRRLQSNSNSIQF